MGLGLHPHSFIAIWVPSPQSMSRLDPLNLAIMEVSQRFGSGIIPAVPSRPISGCARRPSDEEANLGPAAMDRSLEALKLIEFVEDTALWAKR